MEKEDNQLSAFFKYVRRYLDNGEYGWEDYADQASELLATWTVCLWLCSPSPSIPRALAFEAASYVRSAAVHEPDDDDDPGCDAVGHRIADEMFVALGVDITTPEHAHDRDPM
jgi:hypothetical protein